MKKLQFSGRLRWSDDSKNKGEFSFEFQVMLWDKRIWVSELSPSFNRLFKTNNPCIKKAALLSLAYCITLYIGGVCLSLSITNGRVPNEHFIIIWGRVPPQNRNCIEILHFWVFQHPFLISWKFEDFSSRTLEVMSRNFFFQKHTFAASTFHAQRCRASDFHST